MKKFLLILSLMCVFILEAHAVPVITGYNVSNTRLSGFGGWSHTYSGTITPTGSTYSYTGGSGTMADGIVGTSHQNTHLFLVSDLPSITVFLDNSYLISNISLYSFEGNNQIPGNITGFDLTIANLTETFATSVLNTKDEFADISSSNLSSISTNFFTLSNFTVDPNQYPTHFSISEITLNGTQDNGTQDDGSIPEPATLALLGFGLAGIGFSKRKKSI